MKLLQGILTLLCVLFVSGHENLNQSILQKIAKANNLDNSRNKIDPRGVEGVLNYMRNCLKKYNHDLPKTNTEKPKSVDYILILPDKLNIDKNYTKTYNHNDIGRGFLRGDYTLDDIIRALLGMSKKKDNKDSSSNYVPNGIHGNNVIMINNKSKKYDNNLKFAINNQNNNGKIDGNGKMMFQP